MKKKVLSVLLCVAMTFSIFAGCGKKDEMAENTEIAEGGTYAFVPKSADNAFNEKEAEGFKKAVEAAGGTAIISYPKEATVDAQLLAIESVIFQGVDGVCIAANDFEALSVAIGEVQDAGIKVCSVDSAVEPSSRLVHCNQAGVNEIAKALMDAVLDITGGEGQFAVLSSEAKAANQIAWVDEMRNLLETDSKYSNLELVEVAYGDDDSEKSKDQAKKLLENYPELKMICAPTTVGMLASAEVISEQESSVKLTGLGLPSEMKDYMGDDAICPYMFLWNPNDLGALGAYTIMALCNDEITGAEGETFSCTMGEYTVQAAVDGGTEIILGSPYKFDSSNVGEWAQVY